MIIRPARPDDGPAIGKLFAEEGDCPLLDWARPGIAAWWLVAEEDGAVVAALQVSCSEPTGYIGELVVALHRRRSGLARELYHYAEETLREMGCQRVAATLRGQPWWVSAVIETEGFVPHAGPVTLVSKELL